MSDTRSKKRPLKKRPLRFSMYPFEPRRWERKRIHSYSVRSPLWWRSWVKLRIFGAKVGIE